MFSSTITIKTIVLAAAIAAALTVAGCSDNASNTSTSPTTSTSAGMSGSMPGMDHGGSASAAPSATRSDFNDADVMFLQMMYPHHAQAVDMAKLVPARSQNQQVITLAQNIEKAQGPEMTQMTGLLKSFGKPAPLASIFRAGWSMWLEAGAVGRVA